MPRQPSAATKIKKHAVEFSAGINPSMTKNTAAPPKANELKILILIVSGIK